MNPRRLQITLLLRSRYDLSYEPPTWTGQLVARQAKPGEGPSKKVPCPNCGGEKQRRIRGIPTPCELCVGEKGKPLGWVYVDGNINPEFRRKLGTLETGIVTRYAVLRCDACGGEGAHGNGQRCLHCNGSGVVEIPVARLSSVRSSFASAPGRASGDPIIDTLERREAAGSYAELNLALDLLRGDWLFSYRVLQLVYAHALAEPEQLGEENAVAHDFGLSYLSGLMPREIRVPSWAARNERRRREKLKRREVAA